MKETSEDFAEWRRHEVTIARAKETRESAKRVRDALLAACSESSDPQVRKLCASWNLLSAMVATFEGAPLTLDGVL